MNPLARTLIVVLAPCLAASPLRLLAEEPIAADYQGDWVPDGDCTATTRLRVTGSQFILINGKDTAAYGNIGWPTSYFGPDYTGITQPAIAEFEGDQPFMVYFNESEQKGATKVDIFEGAEIPGNAVWNRMVQAAKKLATRFPLRGKLLKKCAPAPG